MSAFETSWLPLKRYADFRGRSTRSELILFSILVFILNFAASFVGIAISFAAVGWLTVLLMLALATPSLALAARRLHDTGRGGWWLLLGLPNVCFSLWDDYTWFWRPRAVPPDAAAPLALEIASGLCGLALLILLLWNDEEAPNRYGPNPRYDAPGETG